VQDIGYDQVLASHATAEKGACSFLDSPPTQPFFLSVGFFETHREYPEPGPGDDPRYCRAPEPLPDTPETRADMAGFHTSVRTLDRKMGLVLEALERNGLAESTLVICTTDHGIAFPRMKCNLTDPGIGVMLMVRGPGGFEGGRVCDALVSQVDVFPTLCDLIGIPRPDWLQGVSLLPLVRGECAEVRDEIRSEVNYHASYEPQRCVRTRRFKYIRRFGDRARGLVRPNCDDSPSKSLWLDNGWYGRTQDTEQLYDLVLDPNEAHNLVADQDRAEVLADMRARLQRWMHETRDPLLDGRVVSAPAGARVNPADGLSPHEPLVDA
jgi:arylsulfatase A-like enzyme